MKVHKTRSGFFIFILRPKERKKNYPLFVVDRIKKKKLAANPIIYAPTTVYKIKK